MNQTQIKTFDCHLHTHHSWDSSETMRAHCKRAVALGADAVCFTDHLDFVGQGLGCFEPEAFFGELARVREEFAQRLEILAGIEFSEPHLRPKELEEANRLPYDFILGSLHDWLWQDDSKTKASPHMYQFYKGRLPKDARAASFALYWENIRQMAACGGFDAIAHLDFPKRYLRSLEYEPEALGEIFALLIKNNIALEINTSSLRWGLAEPMPGEALLRQYISLGGRYITLGSDAHRAEDLYANIPEARAFAESLGLTPVYYKERRMISV